VLAAATGSRSTRKRRSSSLISLEVGDRDTGLATVRDGGRPSAHCYWPFHANGEMEEFRAKGLAVGGDFGSGESESFAFPGTGKA
jgi:hypothetical protein